MGSRPRQPAKGEDVEDTDVYVYSIQGRHIIYGTPAPAKGQRTSRRGAGKVYRCKLVIQEEL